MRSLSSAELLEVWERGQHQHPLDRALTLLTVTCPERNRDALVKLSIGQRDALLFALRQITFGPEMETYAECPACGAPAELNLDTRDVLSNNRVPEGTEWSLKVADYDVTFRLPDSADMAACINTGLDDSRSQLLKRCVSRVTRKGKEVAMETFTEEMAKAIGSYMVEVDPLAEVQIRATCTACGHNWTLLLDILSFFWDELGVQVKQLFNQIHLLARAYGWREADILAMSPWRRQYYLDMVTL